MELGVNMLGDPGDCPLLPLVKPPLSTEMPALTQGSAETQAQGVLFSTLWAASTNVDTDTFLYLPSTSPSEAAHQSGTMCSPTGSNSFPLTPAGAHPLPPSPHLGRRAGLLQLPLNSTQLNS